MASVPPDNARPVVVWFRRDLRTHDNAPLYFATRTGQPVIPLFIFDNAIIRQLPSDGAVFEFQAQALRDLDAEINRLGGKLIVRHGSPETIHEAIIREFQPSALHFSADYEPSARIRDDRISRLYASKGIPVIRHTDMVLLEPEKVLTGSGSPYAVFTPYANAWKKLQKPMPLGNPKPFSTPHLMSDPILGAKELRKKISIPEPVCAGGSRAAEARWKSFLKNAISDYAEARDIPSWDRTSRMSPYLRFGCISIRQMFHDCSEAYRSSGHPSIAKFVDELIWREFYQAVLFHHPHLVDHNYRAEFDHLPWRFDEGHFRAWKEGRTGYPLVDAGMRQLNQSGWMHNRVRMVTASFLTKHLMHHWKMGESYFAEKLLDIETASNNGGWQWSASTGVDPKPLRIFNPRLQSEKYDKDGEYIRRFVPELRGVPGKFIHAPHEMPLALQEEVGCLIGKDYPAPMVNHAEATNAFKQLYYETKRQFSNSKFQSR